MKVRRKKKNWVWHWLPFCVAERVTDTGFVLGRNFLWLNWLFCFGGSPKMGLYFGMRGRTDLLQKRARELCVSLPTNEKGQRFLLKELEYVNAWRLLDSLSVDVKERAAWFKERRRQEYELFYGNDDHRRSFYGWADSKGLTHKGGLPHPPLSDKGRELLSCLRGLYPDATPPVMRQSPSFFVIDK